MSGFALSPVETVARIRRHLTEPGWHLNIDFDFYMRPDWSTGMIMDADEVDRAVVTFVGTREEAKTVYEAARRSLPQ